MPDELVALRKLIATTADNYAADHDHVVVLDDVVADVIAQAIMARYGIGSGQ